MHERVRCLSESPREGEGERGRAGGQRAVRGGSAASNARSGRRNRQRTRVRRAERDEGGVVTRSCRPPLQRLARLLPVPTCYFPARATCQNVSCSCGGRKGGGTGCRSGSRKCEDGGGGERERKSEDDESREADHPVQSTRVCSTRATSSQAAERRGRGESNAAAKENLRPGTQGAGRTSSDWMIGQASNSLRKEREER